MASFKFGEMINYIIEKQSDASNIKILDINGKKTLFEMAFFLHVSGYFIVHRHNVLEASFCVYLAHNLGFCFWCTLQNLKKYWLEQLMLSLIHI